VVKRSYPQRIGCLQLLNLSLFPLSILLPAPFAYGIALLRGDLLCRFGKLYSELDRSYFSREEIISTLKRVLGDQLSPEERSRVARDFFRLRCCEMVDALRFGRDRSLSRLVEIRGLDNIKAALVASKGAILCSAHFGSNYLCSSLLGSLGFPITIIARFSYEDRVTATQRFFNALIRKRLVVRLLQSGSFDVAVQAAILLHQNELIGTMLDAYGVSGENARRITIDFLNGKASLLPGAIKIAQLTGARVLMVFMRRSADWRHQVLEISPPMSVEGDTVTVFRRCFAIVEAAIRRNPAHWRRWTTSDLIVGERAWHIEPTLHNTA